MKRPNPVFSSVLVITMMTFALFQGQDARLKPLGAGPAGGTGDARPDAQLSPFVSGNDIPAPLAEEGFANLPKPDPIAEESLQKALADARRSVLPMSREASEYPENSNSLYHAYSPAQNLVARFLADGLRISPPGGAAAWQVAFTRIPKAESLPLSRAIGSRVEYHHPDGVVEWWDNEPAGLRQSFEVPASLENEGEVRIRVRLDGMSASHDDARPGDLQLSRDPGTPLLGYRDLKAWDANHAPVPARMMPVEGGIELLAMTGSAVFPVIIDPLVTRDESTFHLTPEGTSWSGSGFGELFDREGDQMVVFALREGPSTGSGDVFGVLHFYTRKDGSWELVNRVIPSIPSHQGMSLSISGTVAVLGFSKADACLVYEKRGETWSETTRLDADPPDVAAFQFGKSVEVTPDGILVGAPSTQQPSTEAAAGGSVHFFRKSKNRWSGEARIEPANPAGKAFGTAISRHEGRMVVASDGLHWSLNGAANIFEWNGTGWVEVAELVAIPGVDKRGFGKSVAVHGDSVVVGIIESGDDPYGSGAAAIFSAGDGGWSETQRLHEPASGGQGFGVGVAIGETLLAVRSDYGNFYYRRNPAGFWEPLSSDFVQPNGQWFASAGTSALFEGDMIMFGRSLPNGIGAIQLATADPFLAITGIIESGSDGVGDEFGTVIATDGEKVLVRAGADFDPVFRRYGKVYVFRNDSGTWRMEAQLQGQHDPAAPTLGSFGVALAIEGNTAVIGHTGSYYDPGRVHVFEFEEGTWGERAMLQRALTGTFYDRSESFGLAVALAGDELLVGDPGAAPRDNRDEGMVFSYRRTGSSWAMTQSLPLPAEIVPREFGQSLALQDSRAIVGGRGIVHEFLPTPAGWVHAGAIVPQGPGSLTHFGGRLALSGDTLAVSSFSSVNSGPRAVVIFRHSPGGWQQEGRFQSPSPANFHYSGDFGQALALSGDLCLVGDPGAWVEGAANQGAVFAFTRSGGQWTEEGAPFAVENVGSSVAMRAGSVFLGLPRGAYPGLTGRVVAGGTVRHSRVTSPCPQAAVTLGKKKLKSNARMKLPTTPAGAGSALELLLSNPGSAMLTDFRFELEGPDQDAFSIVSPAARELPAGAAAPFEMTFHPATMGTKSAILKIYTNACAGPHVVQLSGGVIAYPEIEVSVSPDGELTDGESGVDFGQVASGGAREITFRVRNSGLGILQKLALKSAGPAKKDFVLPKLAVKSLGPGEETEFRVVFKPSAAGGRSVNLQLRSSDADESPFDVLLTGIGIARPELDVFLGKAPLASGSGELDFGTPKAGKRVTRKITLRNTGWLDLENLSAELTGDTGAFSVVAPPVGTLPPGKSVSLALTFTAPDTGPRVATLAIGSNDDDESPFLLRLAAGQVPELLAASSFIAAERSSNDDPSRALLEFAFGLEPGNATLLGPGTGSKGLPLIRLVDDSRGRHLRFEYVRRKVHDLVYLPQVSGDLETYFPVEAPEVVEPIDPEWERVVVEHPVTGQEQRQLFGRVSVTAR